MSDNSKSYYKMTDQEKRDYSKHIQTKYIRDFAEYLKIINKGRITMHKRQIIEWVEGLRTFSPDVLDAGWKSWIQKLKPHYVPSISDGIAHFKAVSANISQKTHHKTKHEEMSLESGSDFSQLMQICMSYSNIGPIGFHKNCIRFYEDMLAKETVKDNKRSFNDALRTHKKLLKEAEANSDFQQISKNHQKKIVKKIKEVFVDPPKKKIMRGDQSPI
tara:strand:- start:2256 stop:2906 length:651 start_codon:yes stop_codon:yes gene_type:complete